MENTCLKPPVSSSPGATYFLNWQDLLGVQELISCTPWLFPFCYSVAMFFVPMWARSYRTNRVDRQLNSTMRIITGTVNSCPLPWLIFQNIEPAVVESARTS